MNLEKYYKICILLIILLLVSLLLYIYFYPQKIYSVSDVYTNDDLNNKVITLEGKIRSLKVINNNLFFKICEYNKCLDAAIFNYTKKQKESLLYNESSIFNGKLTIYNDKYELIVYKINNS